MPDRVAGAALLPARVLGPLGAPTRLVAAARASSDIGSEDETFRVESALAERLERAVLRSAWPLHHTLPGDVIATPGEVDARSSARRRDTIRVRVADPERVRPGQGVVAGDVYIGRVSRVHFREAVPDRPSSLDRVLRALRLRSAPPRPPRDAIDVELVTGAGHRVGAVVPSPDGGPDTRLVVGGVVPAAPTVHLAVHTPSSRATTSGRVLVEEPEIPTAFGEARDPREEHVVDGFWIGDLEVLRLARRGAQGVDERGIVEEVLGVAPLLDFRAGLNQVLVLGRARPGEGGGLSREPNAPATGGRWRRARVLALGDTTPWRNTLRIGSSAREGLRTGAAVVDGARLFGRVARADAAGATVARLAEPGFEIVALASPMGDVDAIPLVLGNLVTRGADGGGVPLLEWRPDAVELERARTWAQGLDLPLDLVEVRLFTGSGMELVPRGLLLGHAKLALAESPSEDSAEVDDTATVEGAEAGDDAENGGADSEDPATAPVRLLRLEGAANPRGDLRVWLGPTPRPTAAPRAPEGGQ